MFNIVTTWKEKFKVTTYETLETFLTPTHQGFHIIKLIGKV